MKRGTIKHKTQMKRGTIRTNIRTDTNLPSSPIFHAHSLHYSTTELTWTNYRYYFLHEHCTICLYLIQLLLFRFLALWCIYFCLRIRGRHSDLSCICCCIGVSINMCIRQFNIRKHMTTWCSVVSCSRIG